MKKNDSNFILSQRQVWGIAVLLMLIVFVVACWRLLPFFNHAPVEPEQQLISWGEYPKSQTAPLAERSLPEPNSSTDAFTSPHEQVSPQLFVFDPNTATEQDFIKLGLHARVARTIINYRNKGGKFYKREDFAKIYTLSEQDYHRLAPYIQIKSAASADKKSFAASEGYKNGGESFTPKSKAPASPISLNAASVEQLMQLRGIGPAYANRIVKYRDILGGFYKIEQLKEVYGMSDSLYEIITPFLSVEGEPRKINVNTATEEELYKHPYIRKMAKHIVAFRNEIGGFKHIEEFRQVPLINEEIYRKLVPYLSVNN